MAIDSASLLQQLTATMSGGRTAAGRQVLALAKMLDLKVGQSTQALVTRAQMASSAQQQQLLALAGSHSNPALHTLLNAPRLQLLTLNINGKTLTTFSDQPVAAQQQVTVKLVANRGLTLLSSAPASHASPTQELLGTHLRQTLPRQAPLARLFEALQKVQSLPQAVQQQVFSAPLQQALQRAAGQLKTPQQLAQPDVLRSALQLSGVGLEHGLSKTGAAPEQDMKAVLLRLQGALMPTGVTATATASAATDASTRTLMRLLGSLAAATAPLPQGAALKQQLSQLLQQQLISSLARIQWQQLHTLSQRHGGTEAAPGSHNSWQLELPVAHGNEVRSIEVRIEEQWADAPAADGEGREKVRQWSVQLDFDLPHIGALSAHLKVIGESLSASIWVEREATLGEARLKLQTLKDQLLSQGLEITQLQCLPGRPPEQNNVLSYSLVDVTT